MSLAVLGLLLMNLSDRPSRPVGIVVPAGQPLIVYCAASNKSVMETVRQDYEREFGTPVQVQFGPSQALLASLEVNLQSTIEISSEIARADAILIAPLIGRDTEMGVLNAFLESETSCHWSLIGRRESRLQ